MKKTLLFSILIMASCCIWAQPATQTVVASSGNSFTANGVTLEWTLGEVAIETLTGSNATLTQGFHQGNLTITAIEPSLVQGFDISVYPNPVSDILFVKTIAVDQVIAEKMLIRLFDQQGKLLVEQPWQDAMVTEEISLSTFSKSVYYLVVLNTSGAKLKTFIVEKVK